MSIIASLSLAESIEEIYIYIWEIGNNKERTAFDNTICYILLIFDIWLHSPIHNKTLYNHHRSYKKNKWSMMRVKCTEKLWYFGKYGKSEKFSCLRILTGIWIIKGIEWRADLRSKDSCLNLDSTIKKLYFIFKN